VPLSTIKAQDLQEWGSRILQASGVAAADADLAAEILVRSDLRGVGTHGVARLGPYSAMLKAGAMNPAGKPVVSGDGPLLQIDAHGALGQIAGPLALKALCRVARRDGAAIGIVRETGHLGALGVLLLQAAEQGLVAFMAQNGPPAMALPGAAKASIGNNPFAFAAPMGEGEPPLVVDMATSAVALGKIFEATRANKSIPVGWAIGQDGQPTTDPAAALQGFLMPMGGHKGIGLAFMIEVLAGALTGTRPLKARTATSFSLPPAFGAFIMIVDPAALCARDDYESYLARTTEIYRESSSDARYPGEGSAALEAERRHGGVPLGEALHRDLKVLGEQLGVPFPAAMEAA